MARFYTIARLSNKQSLTPEKYLLCEDVPIARTGDMLYGGEELEDANGKPVIRPDEEGLVLITRSPKEVFRPETIASFNGKSVTNDHPPENVDPSNWKELTVGVVMNVRKGQGAQDDLLLADLLITDPQAIEDVRKGKREVSCGYDADYSETSKGKGKQENLIGNHVALVESGRCGWRCAIGDRKFNKERKMGKGRSWLDKAKAAFFDKDEEKFNEAMDEAKEESGTKDEETHIHVHGNAGGGKTQDDGELAEHIAQNAKEHQEFRDAIAELNKKIDNLAGGGQSTGDEDDPDGGTADEKIEGDLEEEAPVGTGDRARKAKDSAYLADSYRDTIALAEILAPGIRIPSFDHKAKPKDSLQTICKLRRQALDHAYNQPQVRSFVDDTLGKPMQTAQMSCSAVRTLFKAVGSMQRLQNNDKHHVQFNSNFGHVAQNGMKSVADLGKLWEEQHGRKSK